MTMIFLADFNLRFIYNSYLFSIMGILFEILGSLFLSMEAIGLDRFTKIFNGIKRISIWSKKSIWRISLLIIPFFVVITYGIFSQSRLIVGLTIPILLTLCLISSVLDLPNYYEKWIWIKTKNGGIGPIGFILILTGNLLQLINVIWQMSLGK